MSFSAFLPVACLFGKQRIGARVSLIANLTPFSSSVAHISRDLVKNLFPEQDS
jgi:hypothetical protein